MTKTMGEMPQRQLLDELRVAIDRWCDISECRHYRCIKARDEADWLIHTNPHNFWSTKVIYNLGVRRLARLDRAGLLQEASTHARGRLFAKSLRRSREQLEWSSWVDPTPSREKGGGDLGLERRSTLTTPGRDTEPVTAHRQDR